MREGASYLPSLGKDPQERWFSCLTPIGQSECSDTILFLDKPHRDKRGLLT